MPPVPRSDISSKHLKYYRDDYLVLNNYTSFTQMLSLLYIYLSLQYFLNMFFIPWHLRFSQQITQHQHGNCRILADGTRIWHLECCHCITSILGRRPRPSHPRHSFWMHLQPFLLDFNQPHPTPVIWRSFIWMFRSCPKCSFYTTAITGRWRLWEWFQQRLTNTLMQHAMHTPCIQNGTCIFQPCTQHTPQTSYTSQWSYSVPLPILQ